jgi:hypothetical protein
MRRLVRDQAFKAVEMFVGRLREHALIMVHFHASTWNFIEANEVEDSPKLRPKKKGYLTHLAHRQRAVHRSH